MGDAGVEREEDFYFNLTQAEIAEVLGISTSTIEKVLNS